MKTTKEKPDKDVLELALFYKNEVTKAGKGFQWPKAKDPTKTYSYRYFKSFINKCKNEYDLNLEECKLVIRSIVKYAKRRGILGKGISIISKSDTIEICFKDVQSEIEKMKYTLSGIEKSNNYLDGVDDRVAFLKKKENRHAFPNMISMRESLELSDGFIALSRSCIKAIMELSDEDRSQLPSLKELFVIKNRLIDRLGKEDLKSVLGSDFNG